MSKVKERVDTLIKTGQICSICHSPLTQKDHQDNKVSGQPKDEQICNNCAEMDNHLLMCGPNEY